MGSDHLSLDNESDRLAMRRYMGNTYQMAGTRHYQLSDGLAKGTAAVDMKTGSGFEYTVAVDRGMDISLASYKGINLIYLTPNGEVSLSYAGTSGTQWMRTFMGGLLTTCGPAFLGPPCTDEGRELPLHGRFSTIPCKRLCDLTDFASGELKLTGIIEDSVPFEEKLSIKRTISSPMGASHLVLTDVVTNLGSTDSPLTLLYHINFGYPLLTEDTRFFISSGEAQGYDAYSCRHVSEADGFLPPSKENAEKNYLYHLAQNQATAYILVYSPKLLGGLGVYIKLSPQQCPYVSQWKLEDAVDYVLAVEPSNTLCLSRSELRKRGILPMIKAGETKTFSLEIGVVEGSQAIENILSGGQS